MRREKALQLVTTIVETFIGANRERLSAEQVAQLNDMAIEVRGVVADLAAEREYVECDGVTWRRVGWMTNSLIRDGSPIMYFGGDDAPGDEGWRPVYVRVRRVRR